MISKKYNIPEKNCKVVIMYDHLNRHTKTFDKIQCIFHSFKNKSKRKSLYSDDGYTYKCTANFIHLYEE
jgi:hypothetical protein